VENGLGHLHENNSLFCHMFICPPFSHAMDDDQPSLAWLLLHRRKRRLLLLAAALDDDDCGEFRRRRRCKYTRASLLPVSQSAWMYLKTNGPDEAWMQHISLTRAAFYALAERAAAILPTTRSVLGTDDLLAIALRYLRTSNTQHALCAEFGVVPSTMSYALHAGLRALEAVLLTTAEARIEWLTQEQKAVYSVLIARFVARRRSALDVAGAFGFVDGTSLKMVNPTDKRLQNGLYNGYRGHACVNNVFVFAPDGCIVWANYHAFGSHHDSRVASALYTQLAHDAAYAPSPPGYAPWCVLADSAFKGTRDGSDGVKKIFARSTVERMPPAERAAFEARHEQQQNSTHVCAIAIGLLRILCKPYNMKAMKPSVLFFAGSQRDQNDFLICHVLNRLSGTLSKYQIFLGFDLTPKNRFRHAGFDPIQKNVRENQEI
jgi:DDE superfamily endonuclease